jgi:hypothetical protein
MQCVCTGLSSGAIVGISVSGVVVLVLVVVLTGVCIGLLVFGYRNPNSKIGLYMIEVRTCTYYVLVSLAE